MRITVFGAGSWGCALAHQMARRGHDVLLWALEPEVSAGINADHRNPIFLTDAELHPAIRSTSDIEEAARPRRCLDLGCSGPIQLRRDEPTRAVPPG